MKGDALRIKTKYGISLIEKTADNRYDLFFGVKQVYRSITLGQLRMIISDFLDSRRADTIVVVQSKRTPSNIHVIF